MYHEIIDSVAAEYEKGKKASREEITDLARDLKKHWKTIGDSVRVVRRDVVRGVKRVGKKAKL